jgi:hypothetical protein
MASGRKALQKATPGVVAADESLLDALAATRRSTFLKTLTTLTDEADAAPAARKAPARKPAPQPKAAAAPVAEKAKKKKSAAKKKKKKTKA